MAINKVFVNNEIKFDISGDTISADKVKTGKTFHNNKGEVEVGTNPFEAPGEFTMDTLFTGTKMFEHGMTEIPEKYFISYDNSNIINGDVINFEEVRFPNCSIIGSSAFCGNYYLKSMSFPECKEIREGAFMDCWSLTELNFPKCEIIRSEAFYQMGWYDDKGMVTLSFPLCKRIEDYAFESSWLAEDENAHFYFPECIYVGRWAFCETFAGGCLELPKVEYLAGPFNSTNFSCIKLGSPTVSSCTIENLDCHYGIAELRYSFVPILGDGWRVGAQSIYVPASLVSAYKSATNWANVASRIFAIEE